jgi:SAM-dependent methyltransferase
MTIQVVAPLLRACGPCRVLIKDASDLATLEQLLLNGCDAWASGNALAGKHQRVVTDAAVVEGPEAVVICLPSGDAVADGLEPFLSCDEGPFAETQVLVIEGDKLPRTTVDSLLLASGWRRHPADMRSHDYQKLQNHILPSVSLYQRLPRAARTWSVNDLRADRPLHMDMLREGGPRADAHIVRYAWAADSIRPGDTVLDCACGLGYGTAVMASLSPGAAFIGVDLCPDTVTYVTANYGRPGVRFLADSADSLAAIPDASVDVVVSMETIEHVQDWEAVLDAFRRVLKPDGRLIASVPDRWGDETGKDPNPHHFHVFDWDKLAAALSDRFVIEGRYGQVAPGGPKLQRAPRILTKVPFEATDEYEWILAIASVNPLEEGLAQAKAFQHPAFSTALQSSSLPVVNFGAYYENPYLYRPMVQLGERMSDPERLFRLANLAATLATAGSADQGAAYCVMGYQALEHRNCAVAEELLPLIAAYLEQTAETASANPHVRRWRLSLAFLAGRLNSLLGSDEAALQSYQQAVAEPWAEFSPLLATKAVASCFYAAVICLAARRDAEAKSWFERGLQTALQAIASPSETIIGSIANPVPFAMQEIGELADMGGQCAVALSAWGSLERDRGAFWRRIDVKRFGVVSWARDLERLNNHLIERIETLRAVARTPVAAE